MLRLLTNETAFSKKCKHLIFVILLFEDGATLPGCYESKCDLVADLQYVISLVQFDSNDILSRYFVIHCFTGFQIM